jgi:hypothetical protein
MPMGSIFHAFDFTGMRQKGLPRSIVRFHDYLLLIDTCQVALAFLELAPSQ